MGKRKPARAGNGPERRAPPTPVPVSSPAGVARAAIGWEGHGLRIGSDREARLGPRRMASSAPARRGPDHPGPGRLARRGHAHRHRRRAGHTVSPSALTATSHLQSAPVASSATGRRRSRRPPVAVYLAGRDHAHSHRHGAVFHGYAIGSDGNLSPGDMAPSASFGNGTESSRRPPGHCPLPARVMSANRALAEDPYAVGLCAGERARAAAARLANLQQAVVGVGPDELAFHHRWLWHGCCLRITTSGATCLVRPKVFVKEVTYRRLSRSPGNGKPAGCLGQ